MQWGNNFIGTRRDAMTRRRAAKRSRPRLLPLDSYNRQIPHDRRADMTIQAKESKHVTPEMCAVLQYTAEHGCMAKIGEPWLGPARLLERQGLIVLWRCLAGHYAARLTPAGAELLSAWRSCAESAARGGHIEEVRIWRVGVA
jgi:hypothetical protein